MLRRQRLPGRYGAAQPTRPRRIDDHDPGGTRLPRSRRRGAERRRVRHRDLLRPRAPALVGRPSCHRAGTAGRCLGLWRRRRRSRAPLRSRRLRHGPVRGSQRHDGSRALLDRLRRRRLARSLSRQLTCSRRKGLLGGAGRPSSQRALPQRGGHVPPRRRGGRCRHRPSRQRLRGSRLRWRRSHGPLRDRRRPERDAAQPRRWDLRGCFDRFRHRHAGVELGRGRR